MTSDWESRAAKKRQSILDAIPYEWRIASIPSPDERKDVTGSYIHQYLSPEEIDITETGAVEIISSIKARTWTVTQVVKAFCHRAALAHQLTNCLHEIFFDKAIARAQELDASVANGAEPSSPLFGLPVSLKDQFHVPGVETTMGYVGWIDTFEGQRGTGKERIAESELSRELGELGAILYCKTSLPHTVMSMVTWNNIVGRTTCPQNRLMSAGGSSGGEGALVGLGGSPVGWGTDIGGSIRIPSGFSGISAIRPTFGRFPYVGAANSNPGQASIPSVCGPMAPTVEAVTMMYKAVLTQQPWLHDPTVVRMPWREEMYQEPLAAKLSFGLAWSDGNVQPQPPIKRGLDTIKKLVESMGHEVIEWKPPQSHFEGTKIAVDIFGQDGGLDIHHHIGLSGEALHPGIGKFFGTESTAPKTADVVQDQHLRLRSYQKTYMDYWNSTAQLTQTGRPVDFVIAPVTPFVGLQVGASEYIAYTTWVNALDYPSVVIPVTRADKNVDKPYADFTSLSDTDAAIQQTYDPEAHDGTPVGVQIVGRRFEDERALGVAQLLQTELRSVV